MNSLGESEVIFWELKTASVSIFSRSSGCTDSTWALQSMVIAGQYFDFFF